MWLDIYRSIIFAGQSGRTITLNVDRCSGTIRSPRCMRGYVKGTPFRILKLSVSRLLVVATPMANRLKPVGGDGASIGGMLIWCMDKAVHRYVGVMQEGNSYAGNRRSEPEGWRWENVFGYQPGIRSRQRRAGGAPPRNLAGNPDSPQAAIFLTSITDVMMGS